MLWCAWRVSTKGSMLDKMTLEVDQKISSWVLPWCRLYQLSLSLRRNHEKRTPVRVPRAHKDITHTVLEARGYGPRAPLFAAHAAGAASVLGGDEVKAYARVPTPTQADVGPQRTPSIYMAQNNVRSLNSILFDVPAYSSTSLSKVATRPAHPSHAR